jgi:protease IV
MAALFRFIGAFFKTIWSALSFFRALVFNLLFLGLLAIIFYSFLDTEQVLINDDSILKLSISGSIVEERSQRDLIGDYAGRLLGMYEEPRETVLQDILDVLDQARDDSRIAAVLLDLKYMGAAGLNQLQAIGAALDDFKSSGKPIICAEDYLNQSQYYLAAHADSLILNPMGGVNLHGLGLYRFYFKDALEKLQVNFHVFQVGSYKSALEPITRNSMSAEDRSQSREWLSILWNNYTADVAAQRSIEPADIDAYINSIPQNLQSVGGDTAKLARTYNLVDELMTRAQIRTFLAEMVGAADQDQISQVSFNQYLNQVEPSFQASGGEADQIGLIFAQGTIVASQSQPGTVGSETIGRQLRSALEDEHIKAVVLRVDSGGGSAFASEIIRQEVLNFKKSNKPLIVSMGNYAASGGYWIAANADEIWAAPTTLTGSIGIFMAVPTFEDILHKTGVHRDGVGTTNLASGLDLSKPLSDELRGAIESTLQNGYDRFISIVAEGRGLDRGKVEQLAQGRVYAGSKAREIGLIDNLGRLDQAIEAAAERAGLDDFTVTAIQPSHYWWDRFFQGSGVKLKSFLASTELGSSLLSQFEPLLGAARSFLIFPDPNGMYAHCMINYIL